MSDRSRQLLDAHTATHLAVIALAEAFVAALTALELDEVIEAWRRFRSGFDAHVAAEEAVIFPLAGGVPLPAKGDLAMLARDHALLRETIVGLEGLMGELAESPSEARRLMLVRHLDLPARLLRTLDHHLDREDQLFYPRVAEALDDAGRQRAIAALLGTAG
jgi:hemerythrin-like domain-containing protein